MINEVPIKITEAARAVTLRHPNAIDCVVYRKVNKRTAPGGEEMGGAPTLGGLGVLSSDDEPEFEYQALGPAKMLITGQFEPSSRIDSDDALVPQPEAEAQIECVEVPGFEVRKNDLIGAMPGGGVLIGFEVVDVPSTVNIYPYTTKYIISPRDELHDLEPWSAA